MQIATFTPSTKVLANFLRQEPRILGIDLADNDDTRIWVVVPDGDGNPQIVFCQGRTECMAINKVKEIRHLLIHPDAADLDAFDAEQGVEYTPAPTEVDCFQWHTVEELLAA